MSKSVKSLSNLLKRPINALVQYLPKTAGIYGIYSETRKQYIYIGYSYNVRKSCQTLICRYEHLTRSKIQFILIFGLSTLKPLSEAERKSLQLTTILQEGTDKRMNKVNPVTRQKFR